jgi:SnoaL-like domain
MPMNDICARRIENVRNHMALEMPHDWNGVIATFAHPRYELLGPGTIYDGEMAVRSYFEQSRIPFPDQGNEIISIAAAQDNDFVLVEFWLTGTHLGPLRVSGKVIEATGRAFRVRMAASFEFAPETDRIICERAYYDQSAVLKALDLA